MSESMLVECYRDLCKRGVQYCVDEQQKCYLCEDVAQWCGQPRMPWQCDSYCKDRTIRELIKNLTMSEMPETLHMNAECDSKWLILIGVAAVAFFIMVIVLAVWIYRLKRNPRGLSVTSSISKPGDEDNEQREDDLNNPDNERQDLLDNTDSRNNGDNGSVAIDMPEIRPDTDPKPKTTDTSTSMTSLLAYNKDNGKDETASKPSDNTRLSVENTGCPGPRDICMRNLPNPMKQMPPKETDRDECCFS